MILPLAMRLIVPPLTSEAMNLVKNTAVALTIGLPELTMRANEMGENTFQFFAAYIWATIIYIVYPSRQDLRPDAFASENFCTQLVGLLYRLDTNTNVCPSLHCAYSIGIASAWLRERQASRPVKAAITALAVLICASTAFIKQHSVVDFLAAIPVCLLAEYWVYGRAKRPGGKRRPMHTPEEGA